MIVDIVAATAALRQVSQWTDQDAAAAQTAAELFPFTGLELLSTIGAGTYDTVADLVAASTLVEWSPPPRAAVVTDGTMVGFLVGYGVAVVPAGRTWAQVDVDPDRFRDAYLVPGITYTGRPR